MRKPRQDRPKAKPRRARPRLGRPPGATSAQTRARILTAARECFVRVGYERATNRDVAKAAGVTAGAIYQYFDSKTALYLAVASEAIDEVVPRLRAATSGQPSTRAALRELVRAAASTDDRHASAARFLSAIPIELQRHPELARGMIANPGAVFDIVRLLVAQGVRDGEIARDKADRVLMMMIATFIGLTVHGSIVGSPYFEAAAQGFIDLLNGDLFC